MNSPILLLLRPHQWLKNGFVFTPLFFSGHAAEWCYVWPGMVAFVAFCLAASGIYCLNDIHDAEADRLHPVKCLRPVASGAVSKRTAYIIMLAVWLLAFALIAAWSLFSGNAQKGLAATMLSYVAMNIFYCVKLKQIPLLDVFMIAMGFVLRILAGGFVVGIHLSHWIVLTTFLLALFLALSKRYDDVALFEASGVKSRKNISQYNKVFLGPATAVLGSITIMCYILYTLSSDVVERIGSQYLYTTSLFVLAGILRYMQLTFVSQKSGSPTDVLLHDHFIHACILGWVVAFTIILYV